MAKRHVSKRPAASQSLDVAQELANLEQKTAGELAEVYAELFGEACRSRNKKWLVRRIIWRMQANVEGDLSERARQRAAELADGAEVRTTPPKDFSVAPTPARDPRLPLPGNTIIRKYKGCTLEVHVKTNGFEYEGEVYKSLSLVAKTITGSHCNGFRFFKLGGKP